MLLTRGEHDEVSVASAQQLAAALGSSSGGQVISFKGSGSYMHIGMCVLCVCVSYVGVYVCRG